MATIAEVNDKLAQMKAKAPAAARAAALGMGLLMTSETLLTLRTFSHPQGEPTNSPPGSPPAWVSGALAGSVRPLPPMGSGPVWSVIVGGTTVYARIQELGGDAGRDLASHLPPRPYLKPTAEKLIATGKATDGAVKGWLQIMGT